MKRNPDGTVEYTPEEIDQICESAMNSTRASYALEGMYISDHDFEKIKAIAYELEQVV